MENWKWNLWREGKNQNGCISNHFAAKFKDKNEMNMCYLRNQMTNRKATLIHQIAFTAMATANKHRKRHKSIDVIHWHRTIHTIYYIDINDRWRCARKMDTHIVSKSASQRLYFGKKIEKFLPFIVDMRAITGQWWQTVWPAFMTKSCRYLICT